MKLHAALQVPASTRGDRRDLRAYAEIKVQEQGKPVRLKSRWREDITAIYIGESDATTGEVLVMGTEEQASVGFNDTRWSAVCGESRMHGAAWGKIRRSNQRITYHDTMPPRAKERSKTPF